VNKRDRERLDNHLACGDQAAYEAALADIRDRRRPSGRAERVEARQREEALEHYLDQLDLD
jgi:hypothetical protein